MCAVAVAKFQVDIESLSSQKASLDQTSCSVFEDPVFVSAPPLDVVSFSEETASLPLKRRYLFRFKGSEGDVDVQGSLGQPLRNRLRTDQARAIRGAGQAHPLNDEQGWLRQQGVDGFDDGNRSLSP
jgi:hypothetical protein